MIRIRYAASLALSAALASGACGDDGDILPGSDESATSSVQTAPTASSSQPPVTASSSSQPPVTASSSSVPISDSSTSKPSATESSSERGCSEDVPYVAGTHEPCERLAGYGLFDGWDERGWPVPAQDTFVYTLNTSLFSDDTLKLRTIRLPEGADPVQYEEELPLAFPVGTIITKTFAEPEDLRDADTPVRVIETRLLILEPDGWRPVPYEWHFEGEEPIEARMRTIGRSNISLSWIDRDGEERSTDRYRIPARTECGQCHLELGHMDVIGPRARHLNGPSAWDDDVENQLAWWAEEGWLEGLPEEEEEVQRAARAFEPDSGTLDERARAWLDINCSHCHNDTSDVAASGLDLRPSVVRLSSLGVCKTPSAAGGEGTGGHRYDIVPGHPERSILQHRIEQDISNSIAMMPRLGRSITDWRAVELIDEWIAWLGTEEAEQRYPGITSAGCID